MKKYSKEEVINFGNSIDVDWNKYNIDQVMYGLNEIETEHGTKAGKWNISNDDPIVTMKIALAHLDENSRYYLPYLKEMEENAKKEQNIKETSLTSNKLYKELLNEIEGGMNTNTSMNNSISNSTTNLTPYETFKKPVIKTVKKNINIKRLTD